MNTSETKSQFRNFCSCGNCRFLGRCEIERLEDTVSYDLYYCPNGIAPSFSARYSNAQEQVVVMLARYEQVPPYIQGADRKALLEAKKRWDSGHYDY